MDAHEWIAEHDELMEQADQLLDSAIENILINMDQFGEVETLVSLVREIAVQERFYVNALAFAGARRLALEARDRKLLEDLLAMPEISDRIDEFLDNPEVGTTRSRPARKEES